MPRPVYSQAQMTEFLIQFRERQNKIDAYKRAGWLRANEAELDRDYDRCRASDSPFEWGHE